MLGKMIAESRTDPTIIDTVRKAEENLVGKIDELTAVIGGGVATEHTRTDGLAYPTSEPTMPPDITFYNLFVIDNEVTESGSFLMNKSDSIAEKHGVDADIIALFANFSDNDERILKMPSLFARRNEMLNRAGAAQAARLGEVVAIEKTGDKVNVLYRASKLLHQQRLIEFARELCIRAASATSELDTIHWSIKRFDLVNGLQNKGLI
ncbi:hypothetical protein FACS1894202_07130 [Clostridia bacterium]|nr:hypothetical protein FACS1894202_07130 [Clostridia bacterium]